MTKPSEEKKVKRCYTHAIITYNTEVKCLERLFQEARHWAYVLHDKDKTDPHIHIIATFPTERSFRQVTSYIDGDQNSFSQPCRDVEDTLVYFTHLEEGDEKFKYTWEDIVYDDKSYWKRRTDEPTEQTDKNVEFVNDLLTNDSLYEMACKYGRDYIKNFKAYNDFKCACLNQISAIERS